MKKILIFLFMILLIISAMVFKVNMLLESEKVITFPDPNF